MKKIRVTVSENMWELLQKDTEEFGINKNRLCNYILNKLKYNREIEFDKELDRENKELSKIVQFDLTVSNEQIYLDILKENKVEIEAEFFRELFSSYAGKIKYQRELFIFEDKVNLLLEGIKKELKVKIKYDNNIYVIHPFFLKRDDQGDENFLFLFNENKDIYEAIRLKELELVILLKDKVEKKDIKYIEKVRKDFDPFLKDRVDIKVKMTSKGESLLKSLTNYRPKIEKKEGHIYYFKTSLENAELYFGSFYNEVEIIEPINLRNSMIENARKILKLYANE